MSATVSIANYPFKVINGGNARICLAVFQGAKQLSAADTAFALYLHPAFPHIYDIAQLAARGMTLD